MTDLNTKWHQESTSRTCEAGYTANKYVVYAPHGYLNEQLSSGTAAPLNNDTTKQRYSCAALQQQSL